jgi:AcrR family transcriptional regulator
MASAIARQNRPFCLIDIDRQVCYSQAVSSKNLPTARERLLSAANELFYEEGINSVGIDRVIERAGVAKASLYSGFGSKDELVRSYLAQRHLARQKRVSDRLAGIGAPRERILAVFDLLGELFADTGFRGCAFVRASAEARVGGSVRDICDESRAWIRSLFVELAREAGARDAEQLARRLVLLYDGATVSAQMDRDAGAAAAARDVAASLIDAALAH